MTLDIDIAMYARNQKSYGQDAVDTSSRTQKRRRVSITPLSRQTPIDQIAKHMRYTAYKRQEQHNKQVQMLLNQRRFAQNETWRSEYDRLRGSGSLSAEDQQRVDARLDQLLKAGLQIK